MLDVVVMVKSNINEINILCQSAIGDNIVKVFLVWKQWRTSLSFALLMIGPLVTEGDFLSRRGGKKKDDLHSSIEGKMIIKLI